MLSEYSDLRVIDKTLTQFTIIRVYGSPDPSAHVARYQCRGTTTPIQSHAYGGEHLESTMYKVGMVKWSFLVE